MKTKPLIATLCGTIGLIVVYGCGGSTIVSGDTNPRARVVDCLTTPASVAVTIDGNSVSGASSFGSVSGYQIYNNGNRQIVFRDATTNGQVASLKTLFQLDDFYTCIGYQSPSGPAIMVLSDGGNVGANNAQIRFVKVAAGSNPSVDIYITAPGANISSATPTVSGVTLATNQPYTLFQAGTYEVRETPTGSKTPFDDQQFNFIGGTNTTLLDDGSNAYVVLQDQ